MVKSPRYVRLLPYSFKKFSILSARRTLLPTLRFYIKRFELPKSDKPALFSMNILPPMATVWYEMVKKHIGPSNVNLNIEK